MITIDLTTERTGGLCDSIISSIKKQISQGILKAETKLPSKRALAEHLGVSVITVQNAYNELISQGYLYSIEKKGFYVTDIKAANIIDREGDKVSAEPLLPHELQIAENEYDTDLKSNATDTRLFPFSQWAHITRQVLNSGNPALLKRQDVYGYMGLRQAIAMHLEGFRNMKVHPRQIVIGAGTESLYSMIVQFMGRDKTYAVENPGYKKVRSVINLNGAECYPVMVDSQGLSPLPLLETQADIIHVSPGHHFPTGVVMPIKRRNELLSWAYDKEDRYIIEDDYDSEFRFNGKPLETLYSLDRHNRVIYINTFSKTLSPSFRISYMIIPATLLSEFDRKLGTYSCPVSSLEQLTLESFITGGHYEKHLIRMKNYYKNLRNNLIYALNNSAIKDMISIKEEEAGLHFIMEFITDRNGREIQDAMRRKKINLPLLEDFYYSNREGNEMNGLHPVFVVNYTAISKEKITDLVNHMEQVILSK